MKTLVDIGHEIMKLHTKYNYDHKELLIESESIVRKLWDDYDPEVHYVDFSMWYWPCSKSPIERCAYNDIDDPAYDSCLFCGKPEERK